MSELLNIYDSGAALYDIAFSWDITDEVDWLIARLGGRVRRVLEPGCGSGRTFPFFAARGIEILGVDRSEEMLARARSRMERAGCPPATTIAADMGSFDFGLTVDGAICPINTFGYLRSREDALRHLESVARHLEVGGKYLLQVDLEDIANYQARPLDDTTSWESEVDGTRVKCSVSGGELDPATRTRIDHFRIEVLTGVERGKLLSEDHTMRIWDWDEWSSLINASPFQQLAAYDGSQSARPELPMNDAVNHGRLTWHELVRVEQT